MRWSEMPDKDMAPGNAASAGRGSALAFSKDWRSLQWITVLSAPVSTRNSIGAVTSQPRDRDPRPTNGRRQASAE